MIEGEYVFQLIDTNGLPLEVVLHVLQLKGFSIDWIGFYNKALSVGWKRNTILSKIEESIIEVYNKETCIQIITRLNNL